MFSFFLSCMSMCTGLLVRTSAFHLWLRRFDYRYGLMWKESRPAKSHDLIVRLAIFYAFSRSDTISRLSPQISRFLELLKSSKSATSSYGKAHSSKETSHFIYSVLIMRNVQRQNFVCVMFVLQSKRRVLLSLLSC
jgi:hypothetical protein